MKKIIIILSGFILFIAILSYSSIKNIFKPEEQVFASIEENTDKINLKEEEIDKSKGIYVPFLAQNLSSPVKGSKNKFANTNQYFFKQKNELLTELNLTAESYYVVDIKTNQVLAEKNISESRQLASITKIMTAMVVLDEYNIGKGDYIEMTDTAFATYGGDSLLVGEKFRVEDLLKATLMVSSNDAAALLSEHFGPGTDLFMTKMNKKAKEIGMSNTNFANPHGLDSGEDHYSTSIDVMKMLIYSFEKYPDIWSMLQIKEETIISAMGNPVRIGNTNSFIDMSWSLGGKTGLTNKAKETFATIFDIQGRKVGIVVLGSRVGGSRFVDTRKIKEWVEINFEQRI